MERHQANHTLYLLSAGSRQRPKPYSTPMVFYFHCLHLVHYLFKSNLGIGFHPMFASRLMMWRQNGPTTKILISFIAASWATPSKTGPDLSAKVTSTFNHINGLISFSMSYIVSINPLIFTCRHTKPGGYVEFIDLDVNWVSPDGSLKPEHASLKFNREFLKASRKAGTEPSPGPLLEGLLKDAGFEGVVAHKYIWPVGTWPADRHLVSNPNRVNLRPLVPCKNQLPPRAAPCIIPKEIKFTSKSE